MAPNWLKRMTVIFNTPTSWYSHRLLDTSLSSSRGNQPNDSLNSFFHWYMLQVYIAGTLNSNPNASLIGVRVLCVYAVLRYWCLKKTHRSSWFGYRRVVYQEYLKAVLLEVVPWMDIQSMWWREGKTLLGWMWQGITTHETTTQNSNIGVRNRRITGIFWQLNTVGRLLSRVKGTKSIKSQKW